MKKLAEFVREQPVTILLIALPFAILGEMGRCGCSCCHQSPSFLWRG
jgi:hypothetical protein